MSDPPPTLSWYIVNAAVENSDIEIQCQIFSTDPQSAVDVMTNFMEAINELTEGISVLVTVDD